MTQAVQAHSKKSFEVIVRTAFLTHIESLLQSNIPQNDADISTFDCGHGVNELAPGVSFPPHLM